MGGLETVFSFFLSVVVVSIIIIHHHHLSIRKPDFIVVAPPFAKMNKNEKRDSGSFAQQVNNLEEILYNEGSIEARIRQLAAQINKDYAGKTLIVIGILKGLLFCSIQLESALK